MGRIGLTGSEQNNITSNDSALAIANESAEASQKERGEALQANWEELSYASEYHQTANS